MLIISLDLNVIGSIDEDSACLFAFSQIMAQEFDYLFAAVDGFPGYIIGRPVKVCPIFRGLFDLVKRSVGPLGDRSGIHKERSYKCWSLSSLQDEVAHVMRRYCDLPFCLSHFVEKVELVFECVSNLEVQLGRRQIHFVSKFGFIIIVFANYAGD